MSAAASSTTISFGGRMVQESRPIPNAANSHPFESLRLLPRFLHRTPHPSRILDRLCLLPDYADHGRTVSIFCAKHEKRAIGEGDFARGIFRRVADAQRIRRMQVIVIQLV